MPLIDLALPAWEQTIHSLHHAVQVVGRVQRSLLPRQRNAAHLPLQPIPFGVHTQPLPGDASLLVDYGAAQVVLHHPAHEAVHLPLHGITGDALLEQVNAAMQRFGYAHSVTLETPLNKPMMIEGAIGAGYAAAQFAAFSGLARFRARHAGRFSAMRIFPHHFDISMLVFAPGNVAMDEGEAHLNFGFAPFTEGQYTHPYLYAYAHPYPDGFSFGEPPEGAFWNREGWTGLVLPYTAIASAAEPEWLIERTALAFYDLLWKAVRER
jgi:hypothetical protein